MKRLIVLILCLWGAIFTLEAAKYRVDQISNVQLLDASRYTSNPDKILSESAVMAIDKACDSLHTAGKAQIAVVVVEDIEFAESKAKDSQEAPKPAPDNGFIKVPEGLENDLPFK